MGLPFRLVLGLGILIFFFLLAALTEEIRFGKAALGIIYWVWKG